MRPTALCVSVCECWREEVRASKTERVWARVEEWKATLIPLEHGGRGSSAADRRGWTPMAAWVLIETSLVTKTVLTGWLNGAAVTEQLSSASHTTLCLFLHSFSPPSHSCLGGCCFNLFHRLFLPGLWVRVWHVHIHVQAFLDSG